jgi:hypothetical protein
MYMCIFELQSIAVSNYTTLIAIWSSNVSPSTSYIYLAHNYISERFLPHFKASLGL